MAMYRVLPTENKMQLFLSTKFADHYQEHDLENWLEQKVRGGTAVFVGARCDAPVEYG